MATLFFVPAVFSLLHANRDANDLPTGEREIDKQIHA
jgi:hypothetical protein